MMEKADLRTPDVAAENVERLAALFPDVVTEVEEADGSLRRTIDVEALRAHVGDVAEDKRERYQFTWPGKQRARVEAIRRIDKTLRPCPERSVDWDTTQNLYIEGDNLDALKILRETYAGKVKMIYIDPPYNTGHDFVYNDSFARTADEERADSAAFDAEGNVLDAAYKENRESNGRFHSDWCSMMYPRLMLARDLLSEDGVIAISIDDSEQASVRFLCDSIFGDSCFLAQIVWQKRTSPDMRKRFSTGHEYVLLYLKNPMYLTDAIGLLPLSEEDRKSYKNPDNDPRGPWVSSDYTAQGFRPNQMYAIKTPSGAEYVPPSGTCWKNIESEYLQQAAEGRFWYGVDGSGMPRRKTYLSERVGKNSWTWWSNKEAGHTQEATKEFKSLLSDAPSAFNFPKPTRLIRRIISICAPDGGIILDFFSGSATTAHAVMQLNAEDGGNRRFIMVQLPEPCGEKSEAAKAGYSTICEIGEERIRRAGAKIVQEVEERNAQLKLGEDPKFVPDVGLRVLKIDSSNFEDVSASPDELSQAQLFGMADNLKPGRTPEDILFQLLPVFQIPYTARIERQTIGGRTVFFVDDGLLVACFDQDVPQDVIRQMAQMQPSYAVMRDASFTGDDALANFEEIFKTLSPATVTKVV